MTTPMPSKKIVVTGIICSAVIVSVGIWQWRMSAEPATGVVSTDIVAEALATSTATRVNEQMWNGVLSTVQSSTTSIVTPDSTTPDPTDNTITGQLAKDTFGQLLALKQNITDGTITADDATQIAQNTLSSPSFSETDQMGKQYTIYDLKNISSTTNVELAQNYRAALNVIIQKNTPPGNLDELTIVNQALRSGQESDIAQLDPIIDGEKKAIVDLLNVQVPSDAIALHLDLVNTASNILANTEGMREVLTDPVKSFSALSQFKVHIADMHTVIIAIDQYLSSKK